MLAGGRKSSLLMVMLLCVLTDIMVSCGLKMRKHESCMHSNAQMMTIFVDVLVSSVKKVGDVGDHWWLYRRYIKF